MHIKVTPNNCFVRMGCFICGASFKMGDLAYDVYDADGEQLGVLCAEGPAGEVCCTQDVETLRAALRERAAALQAAADEVEALADEELTLPSTADVAAAQHLFDQQHFGGCPACGRNDGHLEVFGGGSFVCHEHRTKWYTSSELFPAYDPGPEKADAWARNAEQLAGYREVEPVYPADPNGAGDVEKAVDDEDWPF